MICPACSTENREAANYCRQCGTLLTSHCPRCRILLPEAANYCDHCGLRLVEQPGLGWWPVPTAGPRSQARPAAPSPAAASPPPEANSYRQEGRAPGTPRAQEDKQLQRYIPGELLAKLQAAQEGVAGERRIVTMLFCDVKGSTAAAEGLDPEVWAEIMNGAFEQMIGPVFRYEGTVARLMGDGLLAFFGAPLAHENDPQRAVLAGLGIVEGIATYREQVRARHDIDFDVRVGINTGMVVVGAVGSDLRVEYTALGDAINVAARMEQVAEPGTVLIAHDTYRQVASLFEAEPQGEIAVKGKGVPVPAFRVLGLRQDRDQARRQETESPLVGRDDILASLREKAARTQQGVGHIICLVGEAGLGKSRLIYEMRRVLSAELLWVEVTAASHERDRPYALFQQWLRRVSGAAPNYGVQAVRNGLLSLFDTLPVAQQELLSQVLDGVFGVLDHDGLQGEAFRRQLFAVMSEVWQAQIGTTPTVVVFDDLHWADPPSIELLQHLFPLADSLPVLFLCAFRPERESAAWQMRQAVEADLPHRLTLLELHPLGAADSERMLDGLLRGAGISGRLRDRILQKAEGNPLFVEEVVRALLADPQAGEDGHAGPEDGAEEITIPDSLRSLLTARIDRLQEESRSVLQLASVIGRSFYYRVLQAVAGEEQPLDGPLDTLQRIELIREAARLPELEYDFRHALMQEAAYRSILLRQRRDFHRRVAEAIEQLYPDRLEEFAALLGHHFFSGDDARAQRYYTMAGDSAMRVFANSEAVEYYSLALRSARLGSPSDEELRHLYTRRGRALELNSHYEKAFHNYQEMADVAAERSSPSLTLSSLINRATLRAIASPVYDLEEGERLVKQALPLAEQLGDREAEARIMWTRMLLEMTSPDKSRLLDHGKRALALAQELALRELTAFILHDLWHAYAGLGQWSQASEVLEEARDLWEELGNLAMLSATLARNFISHLIVGNYEKAVAVSEEAYRVAREAQDPESLALSRFYVGYIYFDRGEADRALAAMEEALSLGEAIDNTSILVPAHALYGWALGMLGDPRRGLDLAQDAEETAVRVFPLTAPAAQAVQILLHLQQGALEAAQDVLERMEGYERIQEQVGFLPMISVTSAVATAEVAYAQGNHRQALEITAALATSQEETGLCFLIPDAFHLRGRSLLALDRPAEARAAWEKGLAVATEMGAQRARWPLLRALGELAMQMGEEAKGRALWDEARQVVLEIAARVPDSLRAQFRSLPAVREALEDQQTVE